MRLLAKRSCSQMIFIYFSLSKLDGTVLSLFLKYEKKKATFVISAYYYRTIGIMTTFTAFVAVTSAVATRCAISKTPHSNLV